VGKGNSYEGGTSPGIPKRLYQGVKCGGSLGGKKDVTGVPLVSSSKGGGEACYNAEKNLRFVETPTLYAKSWKVIDTQKLWTKVEANKTRWKGILDREEKLTLVGFNIRFVRQHLESRVMACLGAPVMNTVCRHRIQHKDLPGRRRDEGNIQGRK